MKFFLTTASLLALCQVSEGSSSSKLEILRQHQHESLVERQTQVNTKAVSEDEKRAIEDYIIYRFSSKLAPSEDTNPKLNSHLRTRRHLLGSACSRDYTSFDNAHPSFDSYLADALSGLVDNNLNDYDAKNGLGSNRYDSLVSQCREDGHVPYDMDITFSCSGVPTFSLNNVVECFPLSCNVTDREDLVDNTEDFFEDGLSSAVCTTNIVVASLGNDDASIPYDQDTCFEAYDNLHDRYSQFDNFYDEIFDDVSDCTSGSSGCTVDGQQVSQSSFDVNLNKCREIGEMPFIENVRIECPGSTADIEVINIPECVPALECGTQGSKDLFQLWENNLQQELNDAGLNCNVIYETFAYNDEDDDGGNNIGIIIGAVVGGVVVIVVIVVLGIICCRRKNGSGEVATVGVASAPAPKPQDVEPTVFVPGQSSSVPVHTTVPVTNSTSVVIITAPAAQSLGLTMGDRGNNDGYLVATVKPTSPLLGQIQEGDELTSIDTTDLTVLDSTGMLEALRNSANTGAERKLAIVRGGSGGDV